MFLYCLDSDLRWEPSPTLTILGCRYKIFSIKQELKRRGRTSSLELNRALNVENKRTPTKVN